MDNFLARIAVEESPDLANVSDMVAGRLRERVYSTPPSTLTLLMSRTAQRRSAIVTNGLFPREDQTLQPAPSSGVFIKIAVRRVESRRR